jgi:drug/metabolite transporter (DMT)-like permease
MLVAANLLWGANYAVSKFAYGAWNPLAFSVTRFLIAGVICTALVRRHEGPPRIARAHIPMLLGCAAVGITANQLFFTTATDHTTAGNVVLIMTASPALAAFFAMVAGHEHVLARHWLSLAVSLTGVVLVVIGGAEVSGASFAGDLLAIGAALTWAAYAVMLRPLFKHYSASRISSNMIVWGGIMLIPFALPETLSQDWSDLGPKSIAAWCYSMFFALIVTNILYFRGLRSIGASRGTLYMYLQPFVGVLVAAAILGESISLLQAVGGCVIIAGVSMGNLMPAATVRE